MKILFLFLSVFFAFVFTVSAQAGRERTFAPPIEISGRVVGVHDGDTCTVLDANKRQWKIRFDGIDAPELAQPFGNKSKQNLSDLIFGKDVTVVIGKTDKYRRSVGKVIVGGTNANLAQIKAGMARHYKKYQNEQTAEDRETYAAAETTAQTQKLGIWTTETQAPWDYRTTKKEAQAREKANRLYQRGAKGGCFYINSSGNKTYVNKSLCG